MIVGMVASRETWGDGMRITTAAATHRGRKATPLGQIRAMVLLGGSVGPTPFTTAVGRLVLDLPVRPGRSLLTIWNEEAGGLANMIGGDRLPVRLLIGGDAQQPNFAGWGERL